MEVLRGVVYFCLDSSRIVLIFLALFATVMRCRPRGPRNIRFSTTALFLRDVPSSPDCVREESCSASAKRVCYIERKSPDLAWRAHSAKHMASERLNRDWKRHGSAASLFYQRAYAVAMYILLTFSLCILKPSRYCYFCSCTASLQAHISLCLNTCAKRRRTAGQGMSRLKGL